MEKLRDLKIDLEIQGNGTVRFSFATREDKRQAQEDIQGEICSVSDVVVIPGSSDWDGYITPVVCTWEQIPENSSLKNL